MEPGIPGRVNTPWHKEFKRTGGGGDGETSSLDRGPAKSWMEIKKHPT